MVGKSKISVELRNSGMNSVPPAYLSFSEAKMALFCSIIISKIFKLLSSTIIDSLFFFQDSFSSTIQCYFLAVSFSVTFSLAFLYSLPSCVILHVSYILKTNFSLWFIFHRLTHANLARSFISSYSSLSLFSNSRFGCPLFFNWDSLQCFLSHVC